jgi:HEAT repeat protein
VPDIKEILTSGTDDAKIQAIRVLRRVSPADAKAAIPSVAGTLRGKDLNARAQALQLAGELGPDAKPLVPALKELAADSPPHVRLQSIQALQKVSPEDARASAAGLGELIRGPDVNLRNQAIQVVGEIGPEGVKAVLPTVLEGLKSPTPATRSAALSVASRLNAVQYAEGREAVLALLKGGTRTPACRSSACSSSATPWTRRWSSPR